jgi:hypothetical protein
MLGLPTPSTPQVQNITHRGTLPNMSNRKKPSAKSGGTTAKLVVGRERFAKISAVEGIVPSTAMKARVARFDRQGLSAAERRREIINAHKKG